MIWRPLVKQKNRPKLYPPKIVSEFADMFDIEGFEQPAKTKRRTPTMDNNLEIRNFQGVPMANILAVLPKTKLVFRPADALLFDMISLVTFALVAGSVRLDSPRLDLLALISVTLWIIRTVIRYSNKLARYDLLVKNFLTSKISHRNEGALKYVTSEAGLQRAIRASLVLTWMSNFFSTTKKQSEAPVNKSSIQGLCVNGVNEMLEGDMEVQINVDRALEDLEDVGLIEFSLDQEEIINVTDAAMSASQVEDAWNKLLLERDDGRAWDDDEEFDPSGKDDEMNQGAKQLQTEIRRRSDIAAKRARSFLLSPEENKKRIALIQAAQKKGYERVQEAKKILEESEAIKAAQKKGYEKVQEAKKILEEGNTLGSIAAKKPKLLDRDESEIDSQAKSD